jgi:hypothetical protein
LRLPMLNAPKTSEDLQLDFNGYNHQQYVPFGSFREMTNLSARKYPALATREKRSLVRQLKHPHGIFANGTDTCYVDGTAFYYNDVYKGTVLDSDKQIVQMGAFILIFPDNIYYNTSTGAYAPLANTVTVSGVVVTECDIDGAALTEGAEAVYVKLSAAGINTGFSQFDVVNISGTSQPDQLDGYFQIGAIGTGYIVVISQAAEQTEAGPVTLSRSIPALDYVTECDNRLWGCSSANHEIYASALGDPSNWFTFQGLSTDSFAVTVGTPGSFTGCATHLGQVLFFKENHIHKIFGSKPSNYQMTTLAVRGVKSGSAESVCIVNETLFYHNAEGIVAFDGAQISEASAAFGGVKYSAASAGGRGTSLYVSMSDADGDVHLFCLDTKSGIWSREDDLDVEEFAGAGQTLYALCSDGRLWAIGDAPTGAVEEDDIAWSCETGDIGIESPYNKYLSRLLLRVMLGVNASMHLDVQYDTDGMWRDMGSASAGSTPRSVHFPIIPRRCDHMAIRLRGTGDFTLMSIGKTTEIGTELQEGVTR